MGKKSSETGEQMKSEGPDLQASASSDLGVDRSNGMEDEHKYLSPVGVFSLMLGLSVSAFLLALDSTVLSTAIPRITSRFHSIEDIGWYGSAYFITLCSCQPLAGKLYTHFSSKYTFFAFLGIFELGSIVCATAPNSKALIVGRAVAGIGSSGLTSGALTIISAAAPLEKRPVLIGLLMSTMAIGAVAGPLIGGALTQHVSWRWCFYINLPAGALTTVLLLLTRIPQRTQPTITITPKSTPLATLSSLDLPGFALFAPAVITLLLAIQWGGTIHAWSSPTIISLFIISPLLTALFLFWERHRGPSALIPLSILLSRPVAFACATSLFQMGAQMVVSYYLPIWFQVIQAVSPTTSGVRTLPLLVSQMLAALVSGVLVSKSGYPSLFAIIGSATTSIGAGLLSAFSTSTTTGQWIGYQIINGAGRGMLMQMPVLATQAVLPPANNAIGSSLLLFFQFLGGAVFLGVSQTAFLSILRSSLTTLAPSVNAAEIATAGASASSLKDAVGSADLEGVIRTFNRALTRTFYLAFGAGCVCFALSWGMGWNSIKKGASRSLPNTPENEKTNTN